jgi:type VI secretion system protein ImpE
MLAQQLVREGDLTGALTALQDVVRKDASNAKHRVFLFQLLAVQGQWKRALNQLNVAGELDAGTLPMVQTYREAIQCEALRAEIFSGKRAPLIFGEPQAWLAQLLEGIKQDAGDPALAAATRAAAFDAAPASTGSINGERFEWLADADQRMGPVIEAIVNGRYFWIPLCRIRRIEFDPPTDLRDAVWTAVSFTWANGAETVGLIPTRYSDTAACANPALLLGRRTEWRDDGSGLGQRMLVTDLNEYALMDVRLIEIDPVEQTDAEAGGDAQHG